jgi:hypothetical protein
LQYELRIDWAEKRMLSMTIWFAAQATIVAADIRHVGNDNPDMIEFGSKVFPRTRSGKPCRSPATKRGAVGCLVEALRPGLYDQLDEATLNAALATIDSMQPRSELQAILAVQIIATGFAGLRFLRQSHRNMTEDFINVYGNYAIKLLRLQNDMIQTFDRYQRGNKQTVEVRHVHIHPGGQGVVGIINPPDDRDAGVRE